MRDEYKPKFVNDYTTGRKPIRAIAAAYGYSYGTVHRVLKGEGVAFRSRGEHALAGTAMAEHDRLPDTAGARPRALLGQPAPATDPHRLLTGISPPTAPDDEALIDAVLLWITSTSTSDPQLAGWACWAEQASRRLHGHAHRQSQRAALAHAAVQLGVLTDAGTPQAKATAATINARKELTHADDDALSDHLTAYAALHTAGACDTAIIEMTHALHNLSNDPQTSRHRLAAITIVLTAMLAACGHDHHIQQILDDQAEILGPAGSLERDLAAECALTVTATLTAGHPAVCTGTGRPTDVHDLSALLHAEPPDTHHTPAPHPTPPGAVTPRLGLSELLDRLDDEYRRAERAITRSMLSQWTADAYLVCDSCRLALSLGATTVHPATPWQALTPLTVDGQPAWQHPTATRAVWRLLSEHPGHDLRAITDRSHHYDKYRITATHWINTHDHGRTNTSHQAYTNGWPGEPTLAYYPGATPRDAHAEVAADACLIRVPCRLELNLGNITMPPGSRRYPTITTGEHAAADTPAATIAVFRLLTDHLEHDLLNLPDSDTSQAYMDDGQWSSTVLPDSHLGFGYGDLSHSQYIHGWPEQPSRPRYLGFDPLARRQPATAGPSSWIRTC